MDIVQSLFIWWIDKHRSSPLDSWPFDVGDSVYSRALECSPLLSTWLSVSVQHLLCSMYSQTNWNSNSSCEFNISPAGPPVKPNTIELSNALLCNDTWFSCLMQPIVAALGRNPPTELGDVSVLPGHEAVAEFYLEVAQLSQVVAPLRVSSSFIISSFKSCCIETWLLFLCLLSPSVALCTLCLWFAFRHSFVCRHKSECYASRDTR